MASSSSASSSIPRNCEDVLTSFSGARRLLSYLEKRIESVSTDTLAYSSCFFLSYWERKQIKILKDLSSVLPKDEKLSRIAQYMSQFARNLEDKEMDSMETIKWMSRNLIFHIPMFFSLENFSLFVKDKSYETDYFGRKGLRIRDWYYLGSTPEKQERWQRKIWQEFRVVVLLGLTIILIPPNFIQIIDGLMSKAVGDSEEDIVDRFITIIQRMIEKAKDKSQSSSGLSADVVTELIIECVTTLFPSTEETFRQKGFGDILSKVMSSFSKYKEIFTKLMHEHESLETLLPALRGTFKSHPEILDEILDSFKENISTLLSGFQLSEEHQRILESVKMEGSEFRDKMISMITTSFGKAESLDDVIRIAEAEIEVQLQDHLTENPELREVIRSFMENISEMLRKMDLSSFSLPGTKE